MRKAIIIAAGSLIGLAGCASFSGAARPVLGPHPQLAEFDQVTVYRAFHRAESDCSDGLQWPACREGMTREQYRNLVVDLYMTASDSEYARFRENLSREAKSSAFGGDLVVLLLNAVSVVSGDSARRGLSSASAFVTGAQLSVDQELLLGQTWVSLMVAMDAGRNAVKADILQRLTLPADAYPIDRALGDVRRLDAQASLTAALDRVSRDVAAAAEVEQQRLEVAYTVALLGPLADRKAEWLRAIEAMDDAGIAELARTLGAEADPDRTAQIGNLRIWIGRNVQDEPAFQERKAQAAPVLARAEARAAVATLDDAQLAALAASLEVQSDDARQARLAALNAWIDVNVRGDAVPTRLQEAITAARGGG